MVWCPDYDESIGHSRKFVANHPAQAAMMWAENRDKRTETPKIANGEIVRVSVQSIRTGSEFDYFASGEMRAVYDARLIVTPNLNSTTPPVA